MNDPIHDRVCALTTRGHHHNDWPDMGEVVQIQKLDRYGDPSDAYDVGFMMGQSTYMRQLPWVNIPDKVKSELGLDQQWLSDVYFTLAPPVGQVDDRSKTNIVMLFPRYGYVVIGCNHHYNTRQKGRCYYEGQCERCGHSYAVDSGD